MSHRHASAAPPRTSSRDFCHIRHVNSGLQVDIHHIGLVVFYHVDPSFLWSPSTPIAVDMTVHDYAGKSVLTHSEYMAEILQASLLDPVINIIVPVQSCLNLRIS